MHIACRVCVGYAATSKTLISDVVCILGEDNIIHKRQTTRWWTVIYNKPARSLPSFYIPGCSPVAENDIAFDPDSNTFVRCLMYHQTVDAVIVGYVVAQVHQAFIILIACYVNTATVDYV